MADIVYAAGAPPLPFGTLDYPTPFSILLYRTVDPANLSAYEGLAYLLAGAPFNPAGSTTLSLPLAFGDIDYATPLSLTVPGAVSTFYPAATIGRSTAPTDTPANTYVPGKLKPGLNFALSLTSSADLASRGGATVGVIEMTDPDGELDGLLSLGWDGAPLTLLRGDPTAPFSSWSVVASITAAGMLYDQRKKEIQLRDLAWLLNAAPLHGLRYACTGGIEGDAGLTGRIKPYAVGAFLGATPVQVNAGLLVYQVSCSSVAALAVKQGGLDMTLDGDDADYATLAAATIGVGHCRTCKALGLFRLGGAPALPVTVDGIGDADMLYGHATPLTRAQIARRIATGRGAVRLDDTTQIDAAAYVALENACPATVGFYWLEDITKGGALTEVMAGCLGWWFMRLTGELSLGLFSDPGQAAPYLVLTYPAAGAAEDRLGEPEMTDYRVPRRATFVGYAHNYTVFAVDQVAGALDLTSAALLQQEWQYAATQDAFIANSFPTSPVSYIAGAYASQADAQLEAERQQALMRQRRELWQVDAAIDPLADVVGRVIAIQNFNRLGFGATRNFLCVGVESNGGSFVKLRLWG